MLGLLLIAGALEPIATAEKRVKALLQILVGIALGFQTGVLTHTFSEGPLLLGFYAMYGLYALLWMFPKVSVPDYNVLKS